MLVCGDKNTFFYDGCKQNKWVMFSVMIMRNGALEPRTMNKIKCLGLLNIFLFRYLSATFLGEVKVRS